MNNNGFKIIRYAFCVVLLVLFFLTGCASKKAPDTQDPIQVPPVATNNDGATDEAASERDEIVCLIHPTNNKDEATRPQSEYIHKTEPGGQIGISDQEPNGHEISERDDKDSTSQDHVQDTPSVQDLLDAALDYTKASQDLWNQGRLDRAIDALDHAYALILQVDPDNDPDLIQQKEDLRFMISKRILEIHASRHTAVVGNCKAIPLIMNRYVEYEIKRFQGVERRFFTEAYRRSGMFRPLIVKALKEAGLPEDLSWLPLIESGFKIRAMSRARALGLWQFIPSTGYKFGLNRDAWIDERMDPIKSTRAAIEYLKELHEIFGDWTTVLAAYNCGEGTVLKVIRRQKINYLDNFWDLYERLPMETARYVPRFLATLHIVKNPEAYGFDLDDSYPPLAFDTVTVVKQLSLRTVAKAIKVRYEDLKNLNPELRYQVTPPKSYALRVPKGKGQILMAKLDEIPAWCPPKRAYVYHRVRRGETLSLIAMKYHTTVRAIARANNIRWAHLIRAGQRLKIPIRGSSKPSLALSGGEKPRSDGTYVVKKGDSLWLIARKFHTTQKAIMELNELSSTMLYKGQVLKIPGFAKEPEKRQSREARAQRFYRVRPGDNPSYIADKLNIPLSRLLQLNNLDSEARIYPGQVLVVQ